MPLPRRLAALACALAGLAACSPAAKSSPTPAPGLIVWADEASKPAVQQAATRFQADTGTLVQVETATPAEALSRFMAWNGQKRGPDVVLAAADDSGSLAANGVAAPVELGAKTVTFQPVAISGLSYRGKIYGVPVTVENAALIRNTDLVPEAPATFADLTAVGAKLRDAKKIDATIAVGDPTPTPPSADAYQLYPLQASLAAPLFGQNPDGTWDGKLALDNEGGARFAQLLAELSAKHDYDPNLTSDTAVASFTAGRLPFLITGPWNLPAIKRGGTKYAIDPIPATGDRPASPFVKTEAFFVSAKARNQIAAQKFAVDYLGSDDTQTQLARAANRLPAGKATAAADGDTDLQAFAKAGSSGVPAPNLPVTSTLWNDLATTEGRLLAGKSDNPAADWKSMCDALKAKAG